MRKEVIISQIMSYLIVSDKQIHSNEMDILSAYWQDNNFNDEEKTFCLDILGDKDEKYDLENLLNELIKIKFNNTEKQQLITLFCNLIISDMHIEESELKILQIVAKKLKIENFNKEIEALYSQAKKIKEENEEKERKTQEVPLGLRIRSIFSFGKVKQKLKREINHFILQGPKFGEAIRCGAAIAVNDVEFITKIIEDNSKAANECLAAAKKSLESNFGKNASKEAKELEKNISDFIKILEEKVIPSVVENKEVLNRKQRAMNYFTISFLGKTKAGKSTLHSIMTGGGNVFIGSGSQRTTRFNRVYEWDNIRIIDTPGIGAPEEGGRTDEDIALSVIDETDVLCYIVTSDNVQQIEFNFIETIKSRNKPIIILLNVKKDFTRPEVLFKKFIQNPHYWAERKDEENIQGHINHIIDYINKLENFDSQFVKIIPVQLLAARLSIDEEYEIFKDKLYDASHLDFFLDYIRETIIDSIALRRSQTIIDGTTYYVNENINDLNKFYLLYAELTNKIKEKKKFLLRKINNDKQKVIENCLQDIETLFEKFLEQINNFAENNYDLKKDALKQAWETYSIKTMKIEKKIEEVVRKHLKQEQNDIQEYLSDLTTDIDSFFQYNSKELINSNLFNTKRLFSIAGTLLSLAGGIILIVLGSNPVGWILSGIGLLVGLLSNLFKNKEKKRTEAIEKLTNSLQEAMEENKVKVIEQIPNVITDAFEGMSKNIDILLTGILNGAQTIEKSAKDLLTEYKISFSIMNSYFAKRICDFCTNTSKPKLVTEEFSDLQIERDYGKMISIKTNINITKKKIEEVQNILQEKINIIK